MGTGACARGLFVVGGGGRNGCDCLLLLATQVFHDSRPRPPLILHTALCAQHSALRVSA